MIRFLKSLEGKICDKDGNDLPPDSPPPDPASQCSSNDWFPYKSRVQFEFANFLYRRNQMSKGDTNHLLNLINATLATHGGKAPFHNHHDMCDIIDATTIGEAPWKHFKLNYEGPLPDGVSQEDAPAWMTEEHEVWFHDPVTLLENLLANPDFKDEFDYTPYQEYAADGSHCFRDFMSGNWAWQQAVSHYIFYLCFSALIHIYYPGYHHQRSPQGFRCISCHAHSWQQQNNCLCGHWSHVLLASLSIGWKYP